MGNRTRMTDHELDESFQELVRAGVLYELALKAALNTDADGMLLKQAFGSLVFAYVYGWQALYAFSGLSAIENHARILGLDFKKVCPESTELSYKLPDLCSYRPELHL